MAARVRPYLPDCELMDIFMGTLQGTYFEKMVVSMSSNFLDIVTLGELIENRLKTGKILGTASNHTGSKKPQSSFNKNKEVKANAVMSNVHP